MSWSQYFSHAFFPNLEGVVVRARHLSTNHGASYSNVPASGVPLRGTRHCSSLIWITANPCPLIEPQFERVTRSSRRHQGITVNTDWHDLLALTLFLTMCYLLSEHTVEAGLPIRLRVVADRAKQTATRTGDKTRALWYRYGSSFAIAAIRSTLSWFP